MVGTGGAIATSSASGPSFSAGAGAGAPTVSSGQPTPDGTIPAAGLPGVLDVTSGSKSAPLTIGLTYIDNSTTEASLGYSAAGSVTPQSASQAFVQGINATGGIDGRKLIALDYDFNSDDADYASDASAACAKFTQDNHVGVVLDGAFGTTGGFEGCLQAAGVLDITSQDEGDQTDSDADPLHANISAMDTDRTYEAVLQESAATGYVTKADQLGVIVEDCPEDTRAYARTVLPVIAQLGLKPPKEEQIACTTGFASAGAAAVNISNAILAFKTAHVDRVMFVSYYEAVILLLFGNDAATQDYDPGYMLSSNAEAEAAPGNIPSSQLPEVHGVGNSPYSDVDNAVLSTADSRCLALAKAGGLIPSTYNDLSILTFSCGPFELLERALQVTDGDAGAQPLAAGIDGLGSSFEGPGLVGGSTYFSATRHDGPDAVQVFGYLASCQCIRYSGSPQPAPA